MQLVTTVSASWASNVRQANQWTTVVPTEPRLTIVLLSCCCLPEGILACSLLAALLSINQSAVVPRRRAELVDQVPSILRARTYIDIHTTSTSPCHTTLLHRHHGRHGPPSTSPLEARHSRDRPSRARSHRMHHRHLRHAQACSLGPQLHLLDPGFLGALASPHTLRCPSARPRQLYHRCLRRY